MSLTIAITQMECGWDLAANRDRAEALTREAAAGGARLILLQELFETPYFCAEQNPDHYDLAQPFDGNPLIARFAALAGELGVVLPISFFERTERRFYNSIAIADADGAVLGVYRKTHIPDGPGYQEKFYFSPGDTGFRVWDTAVGRIGVGICWDQWFPEAARLTALAGAQILFYPTAIGWQFDEGREVDAAQHDAWETSQRAHAIANGVFVAAVNRVGQEGDIAFWGQSFVCDPFGRVLARAPSDEEAVLVVECDLARIEEERRHWPFLRDRRIDAYHDLVRRFRDGDVG